MNRNVNTYKRKTTLAIILFIIFTLVVGIIKENQSTSEILRKNFWTKKVHSKKKYNIIFLGDSRIYRGIDTKKFKDGLADETMELLNFGFSSGGYNAVIFNAAEKKMKQNDNKIIVLGITPFSLTPKAQLNQHYLEELNRSKGDVIERLYFYPFLFFFEPYNLQTIIYPELEKYFEKFHNDGWVESYKIPQNPNEALLPYKKEFENNVVNELIMEELFNKVSEWNNKGIKVYAFRPPTTPQMEKLENNLSGFSEQKFILKLKSVGGNWLEIEDKYRYNSYDGSHLHFKSAQKLSLYLGSKVKADLEK
jgi:hypothetical protein